MRMREDSKAPMVSWSFKLGRLLFKLTICAAILSLDVKPQILEITARDGKSYSERVDYPKGNPKNPVTSAELVESFRSMAGYSVKPLAQAKIADSIDFILGLEKVRDVSIIARLLTA